MRFELGIDNKFKKFWKFYLLQSLLAGIAMFILVLILGQKNMVVVSSMGATTFILFALPNAYSAQTRNVIGGHLIGLLVGTIFYFTALPYWLEYPLVIAVAILIMVIVNAEHPPAAGTALAVVINEVSIGVCATIILSTIVLTQVRYYLRHHLQNLL
ncbi:MAG TPA: HPP family protein [Sedimentisphaerales bacterium]|nr:HPP family protein [Sedimentisphaerales bacterium]